MSVNLSLSLDLSLFFSLSLSLSLSFVVGKNTSGAVPGKVPHGSVCTDNHRREPTDGPARRAGMELAQSGQSWHGAVPTPHQDYAVYRKRDGEPKYVHGVQHGKQGICNKNMHMSLKMFLNLSVGEFVV